MKYRISVILFLSISLLSLLSCSGPREKKRYIVAVSPNKPPMEMIDEQKRIVGFDIDVIEAIAERMNISIKIIPVLRSNLFPGILNETYDIAISSITVSEPGLSEIIGIDYSKPYLDIGDVIVTSEDFEEYSGPESLKGKIVGIREESKSRQILKNYGGITIREYKNIEQAFEDMATEKINAVCIDLPTAAAFVKHNIEYKAIFKIHPNPITSENYIVILKTGNTALLNKINTGIDRIKKDGSLHALAEKWFFN
ncbi:MAG: substrate-binding periplasmic protein [Spirochaetota bacterium]